MKEKVILQDESTETLITKAYDIALERDMLRNQIDQATQRVGLLNNNLAAVRQEISKRRQAEAIKKIQEEPGESQEEPEKAIKKKYKSKKLASVK